jgi:hypothetical protein
MQTTSEYSEPVVSDNPFKDVNPALMQHPIYIAIEATPTTSSLPKDEKLKPFFTSTSSTRRANNLEHTPKNETAYVFYGFVNNHGLPMAVMTHGRIFENQAMQGWFANILEVLEKLEGRNFIKKEIEDNIKIQYENLKLLLNDQSEASVSFSVVALYKDSLGQLKSISFGTGDTMVALSDPRQNDITTVVAARNIDDKEKRPLPLPSPQQDATTFSRTLANLEIDIRTVQPNSKFIFLTEGAYAHLPRIEKKLRQDTGRVTVIKTTLKANAIKPGTSLLKIAQDASRVSDEFNAEGVQALSVKDEITVGEMIVPTPDQQKELQAFSYDQAISLFNEALGTIDQPLNQKVEAFKQRIVQMHNDHPEEIASLTKALIRTAYIIYKNKELLLQDISDYVSYIQEEFRSECSFLGGMSDDLYVRAIHFFNITLEKIEGPLYEEAVEVGNQINKLYNQSIIDHNSLINTLINANYLLTSFTADNNTLSPEVISKYRYYIREQVSSKSDLEWKKLGNALITLGISLADSRAQEEEKLAFSYDQAINSFDITLHEIQANKPNLYQKAIAVKNQIEQMRQDPSNNMVSLITTLTKTNDLITRYKDGQDLSQALSDYYTHIQTEVSGKPSLGWMMLGAFMIALGVTLAALGGLNLAVGNVLGGAICGGGGVALILAGCGIFSKGRGKGLYKLTRSFADSLEEENKNNPRNNVSH